MDIHCEPFATQSLITSIAFGSDKTVGGGFNSFIEGSLANLVKNDFINDELFVMI